VEAIDNTGFLQISQPKSGACLYSFLYLIDKTTSTQIQNAIFLRPVMATGRIADRRP
jgi:hypothetical protein